MANYENVDDKKDLELGETHVMPASIIPAGDVTGHALQVPDDHSIHLEKNAHDAAALAAMQQKTLIPRAGERKPVKTLEYWLYILFAVGVTGVGIGNFGSAQNQNLVSQYWTSGEVTWGGSKSSIDSYILDLNGIIFAIQLVLLMTLGPYADYGTWRPYILIIFTFLGIGISFGFTGAYTPDKWAYTSAFYILGTVTFNVSNSFYLGTFPTIVRDLPKMIESEEAVARGEKTVTEHAFLDTLERSKISNIIQASSSLGSCICIAIALGLSKAVGQATVAQNNKAYGVIIGFFGAIWFVTCVPWFFVEQRRAGQKLPDGTSMLTAGPKQIWMALKCLPQLKHTFLYLFSYFLIVDCYSTTGNLVNILQNQAINFSATDFSALFIIVYGVSFLGYLTMAYLQRRFGIPPKYLMIWTAVWVTAACLWGVIGIWTTKIGYHHKWEFFFYQAFLGFMTPGLMSYGPVCLTEVAPAPKMYLFFALYNSVSQTSSFIGPFITSAIINHAPEQNPNYGFWFTFVTGIIAIGLLCCVNVDRAKRDCATYLERERREMYASLGADQAEAVQLEEAQQQTTAVGANRLHEL